MSMDFLSRHCEIQLQRRDEEIQPYLTKAEYEPAITNDQIKCFQLGNVSETIWSDTSILPGGSSAAPGTGDNVVKPTRQHFNDLDKRAKTTDLLTCTLPDCARGGKEGRSRTKFDLARHAERNHRPDRSSIKIFSALYDQHANIPEGSLAMTCSLLEQCRQALRTTIRNGDEKDFGFLCCALSCLLNSYRPLSRRELLVAVFIYLCNFQQNDTTLDAELEELHRRLRKCDQILEERPDGTIVFHSEAMPYLLRNYAISGIDTSHRTWAIICRKLKMNDLRRHHRGNHGTQQVARTLSDYVETFGSAHANAASLTSLITYPPNPPKTTTTSSDFTVNGSQRKSDLAPNGNGNDTNGDTEALQEGMGQLKVSEEVNDWILVEESDP